MAVSPQCGVLQAYAKPLMRRTTLFAVLQAHAAKVRIDLARQFSLKVAVSNAKVLLAHSPPAQQQQVRGGAASLAGRWGGVGRKGGVCGSAPSHPEATAYHLLARGTRTGGGGCQPEQQRSMQRRAEEAAGPRARVYGVGVGKVPAGAMHTTMH